MQFRIRAARATSAHSNRAGLVAALFAAPYLAVPGNAVAQEKFPAKPVTVIVPFKTGQGVDVMAVFVGPGSAYKTLKELIAAAQAQPGSTNWGTTGVGSVPHLSGAAMLQAAKLAATHVPFRGEPQMLQQLLVNEITFAAASVSGMAGKGVRALAVFSDQRHTAFPDVPTMAELGYPAGVPGLNGMFVPRGTPAPAQ